MQSNIITNTNRVTLLFHKAFRMIQTCNFQEQPATINNGGYKKGRWIVWLNLAISPNVSSVADEGENDWMFTALTDRLVLSDNSVSGFLKEVDPIHLSMATTDEIKAILSYFNSEDDIECWKSIRKVQVHGYDVSENVNCFYLDDQHMWLDKATRVGLVNSLNMEKAAGRTVSELWFGSLRIDLNVDMALQLLAALELYAKDCYGVTASHIAEIGRLDSVKELKEFSLCADYPEIPKFKIQ